MPRYKTVEITKGEHRAKALEPTLKAWERNGWTRADDGSSEEEPAAPDEEPTKAPAKKTTRKAD